MRTFTIAMLIFILFQIVGTTEAIDELSDVTDQDSRHDSGSVPDNYVGKWRLINTGNEKILGRYNFAICYSNDINSLFVFGGTDDNNIFSDLWEYRFIDNTWSSRIEKSDIEPRMLTSSFYYNDYLYFFGGGAPRIGYFNDTIKFDLYSNDWVKINADGPSERWNYCWSFDGFRYCYLFGGLNSTGSLNDLWKFDVFSETWEDITPLKCPAARSGAKMAFSNDRLYLFGGTSGLMPETVSYDINVFDIVKKEWSVLKNSSFPHAKVGHEMIIDNKKNEIYIYGGNINPDEFQKYSIVNNHWQLISEDKYPLSPGTRIGSGLVIDNNSQIFLFGGFDKGEGYGYLNDLWRYNTEPTKIPPSLKTPIPNTYSIEEDNLTSGEHLIDLYDYFDDDIHVDELRFNVSYEEDPGLVTASVDGHFLNLTQVKKDWFGQLGFQVRAYDKGWDDTPNTEDDLWVDSNVFNITVLITPDPPVVESIFGTLYDSGTVPEFEATVGWPFRGNVSVNDPDKEPLTFTTDASSDGFDLDSDTGNVIFTPLESDIGSHTWHITVDDGVFDPVTVEFIMNVVEGEPPPDPPVCDLTSPGDGITVGKEVVLGWTTEDAEKSVLFDVYLGNSDPPELYAEGITETQLTVEFDRAGIFYWTVVPRIDTIFGECSSGIWTFNVDLDFVPIYNFSLSASPDILLIEPGDDTVVNLKITNTGNVADSYSISTGGNVVDWVTIPEFDGTVLPGDSLTVPVILNVSDNAVNGNNKIDFTVSSENAGEKTVEVGVEVKAPEETDEKDWVVPAVVGIVVAILAVVGIGFFIQKRKGKEQLEEGKEYQK